MRAALTNFNQESPDWTSWISQMKHRVTNAEELRAFYPGLSPDEIALFDSYSKRFRVAITPYFLSLIGQEHNAPKPDDPLWMQVRNYEVNDDLHFAAYNNIQMNWELSEEMPNSLIHHKYPDRAILRVVDSCFCFCSYCYLTHRTLDRKKKNQEPFGSRWEQALHYLRSNPAIQDVLISGGDPLLFPNSRVAEILKDIRSVSSVQTVRLNTRALSFNPFRFDDELIEIFKEFRLTALEVHFSHPNEITKEVDQALLRMDQSGYRPLLLWRAPLLKNINSSAEILRTLLLNLYERRILPYYLFHYAPYILSRNELATSVRDGVRLMKGLKRTIPGAAVPRYTLFHPTGKQEIPLENEGTPEFQYCVDPASGACSVRFKNWRNEWVEYPDLPDTCKR